MAAGLPSKRRWARIALNVAIVLLVVVAFRAWQQRGTASGPAPAFQAATLDGGSVSLDALRGEPALIHFWASWCGVCRLMDGAVADLSKGHRVITVASWSGDARKVRVYLEGEGLDMPVIVDPDGDLARAYGVRALPTSFVVDGSGRIRHTEVGYTSGLGLRARLWWAGM
jgi:peroxiredoxin